MIDYNSSKLASFSLQNEPELTFNSENSRKDVNPLRGLNRFGPYDSSIFSKYTSELRIATICPASGIQDIRNLVNTLREPQQPADRTDFVPPFKGFEAIFGVPLNAAKVKQAHIKWPDELKYLTNDEVSQTKLIQALRDCMTALELIRDQFDVVLVHFPDTWASACRTPQFDAHDTLKAIGAINGIPTQVINDRVFNFEYKASLAWRLSIALYVKAGGIPWKLAPIPGVPQDSAYIGLAYALKSTPKDTHFVTCCSQVFDADGGGMQFVAFEARDPVNNVEEAKRNPYLSRSDMRAVLSRSINLYQSRNGGLLPRRLVVHKTTPFKPEEIQGAYDALASVPEIELIEINVSSGWRGVWLSQGKDGQRSTPDGYPVPRGTVLLRSGSSALVWVAGNAPRASLKNNYYQGGKSIPRPLTIVRHAGKGSLENAALEALALTKMDWNNDALYDPVPVTIRYSQRLARIIANEPKLPGRAYPYRLFM